MRSKTQGDIYILYIQSENKDDWINSKRQIRRQISGGKLKTKETCD